MITFISDNGRLGLSQQETCPHDATWTLTLQRSCAKVMPSSREAHPWLVAESEKRKKRG